MTRSKARTATQRRAGRRTRRAAAVLLLGAAALPGCVVGPDHAAPVVHTPQRWNAAPGRGLASDPVEAEWWRRLGDERLTTLVAQSLTANLDIRAATARVREARALRGVAAADQWPTIALDTAYQRQQASGAAPDAPPPGAERGPVDLFEAGFDASWEIDLFGRIRRSVEAAQADQAAAEERERDVRVSVAAETARNYVDMRGAQALLDVATRNIAIQTDFLSLTRSLADGGLATDVDVARALAQLRLTESAVPGLHAQVAAAAHRLAVLQGRTPDALIAELGRPAPLPLPPPAVAIGLPGELARRRPDIRAVERELAAATARIGVATADLFPRITLGGTIDLRADAFSGLGDGDSVSWGLGPRLTWPLLDGERIRNRIVAADARAEQSLARYEPAVLRALEECETAMTHFHRQQERRERLDASLSANRDAVRLATERYERGLEPFLTVLDAERDLFSVESEVVQAQTRVLTELIAVYKALGGGWSDRSEVSPHGSDDAAARPGGRLGASG